MKADHKLYNYNNSLVVPYQRSFTEKSAATNKVADCHMEVIIATTPVWYLSKGIVS